MTTTSWRIPRIHMLRPFTLALTVCGRDVTGFAEPPRSQAANEEDTTDVWAEVDCRDCRARGKGTR